MLTADERIDVVRLVQSATYGARVRALNDFERHRLGQLAGLLSDALDTYNAESHRGARLDCLTTAVRALAGALRDRMAT